MKKAEAIQAHKQRRVGGISHKALSLFMSVLLVLMCLPIIPGNNREAYAETTVNSSTPYSNSIGVEQSISITGWDEDAADKGMHGNSAGNGYVIPFYIGSLKYLMKYETHGATRTMTAPAGFVGNLTIGLTTVPVVGGDVIVLTSETYQSGNSTLMDYGIGQVYGTIGVSSSVSQSVTCTVNGATVYTSSFSKDYQYKLNYTRETDSAGNGGPLDRLTNYSHSFNSWYPTTNDRRIATLSGTYPSTAYIDPIVTNSPDLIKNIGTTVSNWAEDIEATWGSTTTNTIPTKGTIDDDTLVGGTDTDLSSTGSTFDRVGVKKHDYTIKDDHSNSGAAQYSGDNTSAVTARNIIVQAITEPLFDIVYAAGAVDRDGVSIAGDPYNGEWTNQPLEMDASHTDPGTYETVIRKYDAPTPATTYVNAAVDTTNAHSVNIPTYNTESPDTTGNDFTAILQAEDPMNLGTYIELSPESAKQNVKIDTTNPVPAATYSTLTGFTDTSTDGLSGIDIPRQKIAVVPTGDPIPANAAYTSFSSVSVTSPGYYDVYVWAWDIAGNNAKNKVLTNILIASTESPDIEGELASGPDSGDALASNTWTNQDVKVTVTPPQPEIGGNYYSALYDTTGPLQEAKASIIQTPVDKTYTAETTGTTLYGVLVDTGDVALSAASSNYVVKIDKTDPTPSLVFNAGTPDYGFTDTSTDTLSPVGANSNIDKAPATTKTVIAIVDAGDPAPNSSDYVSITGAELPATGWYDVWMTVTDIAGNVAGPVKALDHISRSGLDEITAKDFAYDIASGSASLDDDMAKLLSHVAGTPYGSNTDFPVGVLLVNGGELTAIKNAIDNGLKGTTWPLTFSTPNPATQASTTINVTLFDNGPNPTPFPPGPITQEVIYGNDFNWGISSGHISNGDARSNSFVTAYDVDGDLIPQASLAVDSGQLGAINAAIDAGLKDTTWPLTFETPDGTKTTVNVTLYDHGNPIASGAEAIVANDFSWGISTGALTDPAAYYLSSVDATSATGAAMAQTSVIVDAGELADINAAISAGQKGTIWPLTFTTDGSTGTAASTTVLVTLYDAGPVGPITPGNEHVVGNNFNWGISTGSLDDVTSLIRSNAQATDGNGHQMDVFTNVTVSNSDLAIINAAIAAGQKGTTWPLTLTTNGFTGAPASAVIYVTLFDEGPVGPIPAGSEHVVANNFNWGISTGALGGNDIANLSLVAATAANGAPMSLSNINMNPAELTAINDAIAAGQKDTSWPLTFTTDGSTGTPATTTIMVTLFDNGPVGPIPAGSEHIVGNDFNWGITTGAISDTQAYHLGSITPSGAFGASLTQANVSVDAAELADLNAAIAADQQGTTWPLTFTTDGSTGAAASVTIYVTLYHEGPTVVTPGDPHIVANHFGHEIHKGSLSDGDVKTFSLVAALASDASAGDMAHITPDATHLADINAAIAAGDTTTPSWPLTFTYTCPQTGQVVTASVQVTLLGASDLEVTKSVDNANPLPGDKITYTIKVKNNGVATAYGVWVKDYVPNDTVFLSCDSLGTYGSTTAGREYVNWYLASLTSGQEVVLTLDVKVKQCSPGTEIENTALYETGKPGLPTNPNDDPAGDKTNSVKITVADGTTKVGSVGNPGKFFPKTGDGAPFMIIGASFLVGLVALIVAALKRRKQQ